MAFEPRTVEAPAGTERIGAIACWAFGVAWAIWGISGLEAGVTLAIVTIVALALAVIAGVIAFRRGGDRDDRQPKQLPANWQRRYNLRVAAEFVIIFLTSLALGRAGYPELIPVAVCLIVGVHFFPLAGIFDMAPYRWTAIALCIVAIAGGGLLAVISSTNVRATVGLAAAAVLWASAVRVSPWSART